MFDLLHPDRVYDDTRLEICRPCAKVRLAEGNRLALAAKRLESKARMPANNRAAGARRRSRLMRAMPRWADQGEIAKVYAEAIRKTAETGVKHVVDHVVPLASRWVCGLHVAANLAVITHAENSRKQNRFETDEIWAAERATYRALQQGRP